MTAIFIFSDDQISSTARYHKTIYADRGKTIFGVRLTVMRAGINPAL